MNYQLAPYQPLISRRIEFAPQQLPAAPMVSRRMEFGMRKLKNRLREKTPVLSESEFLPLRSLPPTRSRSQTPAEVLSSISRFAARPPVNTKYRNKTPPTTRFRVIAKPSKPNGIRFNLQEDSDEDVQVDDSQNGIDYEGEGDSGNKISKPLGEPGRPKSGGYKLESVLGWNEATFEAVRDHVHALAKQKLDMEKSYRYQSSDKIQEICKMTSDSYPILKDYRNVWPVSDILKLHLKYTSQSNRRNQSALRPAPTRSSKK